MWCYIIARDITISRKDPHIARFMGPSWGQTGPCRHQMGPMLAPWTCYLGTFIVYFEWYHLVNHSVIDITIKQKLERKCLILYGWHWCYFLLYIDLYKAYSTFVLLTQKWQIKCSNSKSLNMGQWDSSEREFIYWSWEHLSSCCFGMIATTMVMIMMYNFCRLWQYNSQNTRRPTVFNFLCYPGYSSHDVFPGESGCQNKQRQ